MTDHQARVVYIWPPSNGAATIAVLWHEHGHVLVEQRGTVFASQADEERWAWGHAWCIAPQSGLGYPIKPTAAECPAYL